MLPSLCDVALSRAPPGLEPGGRRSPGLVKLLKPNDGRVAYGADPYRFAVTNARQQPFVDVVVAGGRGSSEVDAVRGDPNLTLHDHDFLLWLSLWSAPTRS